MPWGIARRRTSSATCATGPGSLSTCAAYSVTADRIAREHLAALPASVLPNYLLNERCPQSPPDPTRSCGSRCSPRASVPASAGCHHVSLRREMAMDQEQRAGQPNRPNVLILCSDQQRFDAVGAYGNEHIQTPALDRLATDGVLFESCYVPNPVCAPSRASLMTGRWPRAHGLWANGVALPEHERLFTQDLADAGYDCG